MKYAINLLFWGYLFVFIRIEIGFDILPVPLGYFMIASGCLTFGEKFPVAKKTRALAIAMIFISLPTIFMNVHEQTHTLLNAYSMLLKMLQLIVVYFIFNLLKDIVVDHGNPLLIRRTQHTFKIYIIIHLLFLTASTFTPNIVGVYWELIIISLMFTAFILDILFLILVRAVRREVPDGLMHQTSDNEINPH